MYLSTRAEFSDRRNCSLKTAQPFSHYEQHSDCECDIINIFNFQRQAKINSQVIVHRCRMVLELVGIVFQIPCRILAWFHFRPHPIPSCQRISQRYRRSCHSPAATHYLRGWLQDILLHIVHAFPVIRRSVQICSKNTNVYYTVSHKKRPAFYFSNNSCQKLTNFNNFVCVLNREKICHQ